MRGFDSASCESESDWEDEVTEGGGGGCGIAVVQEVTGAG